MQVSLPLTKGEVIAAAAVAPAVVAKLRCCECSGWFLRSEVVALGEWKVRCRACDERCERAYRSIRGLPRECGACRGDFKGPDGKFHAYFHVMDGTMVHLCGACTDRYVMKRRDLYGGTPYGQEKGL